MNWFTEYLKKSATFKYVSSEELNETLEDKVFKLQSQMTLKDLQMEELRKRLDTLESGFGPLF